MGLMGTVARQVLEDSGSSASVYGVIPVSLMPKELSGEMRGETIVVETMHERKDAMAKAADCFIALPGGCVRCCNNDYLTEYNCLGV